MTPDSPPRTRMKTAENKKRPTLKSPHKQNQTIVDQLRLQSPPQQSKKRRNENTITTLSQRSVPSPTDDSDTGSMDIEFTFDHESVPNFQPEDKDTSDKDNDSVATKNMDNISKELLDTRVDLRIKVPPHANPEEKTVQVLQTFLLKLQSFDPKVRIAPWYERCPLPPITLPTDFIPRPSELEKFFPRIFFKEEGFTWYSGVRLVHSLPMADLRQDMIRWMKREGHGLFERMLQVPDTTEIGWLVYSTWQMEAHVLAQAIESAINIPVGLRWKQVSNGTRDRIPLDQQVKALHVEVALENRTIAQKALLAVYGRKNSGQYPHGIRLRFFLPIHAAHNLTSKAKLERLRARQQIWTQIYERGFSWEIMQLDHPITKGAPTLRQALLSLQSTTNPKFPIFHSVDRSNYRESGICFQFLPDLADEARMTISNLVPLMKFKYGPSALKLFSPAAVERMEGCHWDPHTNAVVGRYDDEIVFLDEDDPMKEYMKNRESNHKTPPNPSDTPPSAPKQPITNDPPPSTLLHEMDDDSVSTLGNNTHHRWTPTHHAPPPPLTQRPNLQLTPNDEASTDSISTLTTRLTTMETQYNQISGAVQDIKTMLAGLAQAQNHSNKDEPPTNVANAGRGNPPTGSSS